MTLREQLHTAIGRTDASEGLPHWHTVSDTPDGQPRHSVYVERQAVLDIIDRLTPAGVLDEAWEAAEKALPATWIMEMRGPWDGPIWRFRARCLHVDNCHSVDAEAATPAAALHALAAALGRSGSER